MENKQMYVINMETGSYDDYGVETVGVTDDFAKGEAYVNEKNQTFKSMEQKVNAFHSKEYREWQEQNRRPNPNLQEQLPVPKWKGPGKMPFEVRDNIRSIKVKNDEIFRKAHAPLTQWQKDLKNFSDEWVKTNLTEKELEIYAIKNENHWVIEPVTWI